MPNEAQQLPAAEIRELRRRVADLERELAGHRKLTQRLGELTTLPGAAERPFLPALAETLANVLGAAYVIVGELDDERKVIRAPAIYAQGQIVTGSEYELAGTPCADVIGSRSCTYIQGVRERFPHDALLAEWGIESYVGTPLFDSQALRWACWPRCGRLRLPIRNLPSRFYRSSRVRCARDRTRPFRQGTAGQRSALSHAVPGFAYGNFRVRRARVLHVHQYPMGSHHETLA